MSERENINRVRERMINYYRGDPKRVHHFLKVHAFAKQIGEAEGLDDRTLYILELAALTHDIGIKLCEKLYGSASGKYQEFEGPGLAGEMFEGATRFLVKS